MNSALALLLSALVLLAGPLAAQTRVGREQTLHRTTEAGRQVRVFTYVVMDSACQPRPAPPIVLKTAPTHGTISIQPGMSEVRVIREGGADCYGRIIPGTALFYTPAAAFHGIDQFDYDVLTGQSPRHDTAIIVVR